LNTIFLALTPFRSQARQRRYIKEPQIRKTFPERQLLVRQPHIVGFLAVSSFLILLFLLEHRVQDFLAISDLLLVVRIHEGWDGNVPSYTVFGKARFNHNMLRRFWDEWFSVFSQCITSSLTSNRKPVTEMCEGNRQQNENFNVEHWRGRVFAGYCRSNAGF
jgi:hypothetical protein